ncbi:MAG: hypothetical protein HOP11_06170 [Saprospiraceae bacterium]|nr:hypothetical protein [Saprospiraceae bacterium]
MRTRLVVWGTNSKDEKVLLGISLNADDNKINLVSIPAKDCTEEFYNQMMNQWREGADLELPASTEKRTLELTMSESILPEDFRVEKSDTIQRAQMEWHFLVLSTKLYRNFKSELEDMSTKVRSLENYDKTVWDDLKGLWDNIQKHIFDRNIIRDHSDSLREKSNALFEELKKLRSSIEQEFNTKSAAILEAFNAKMEEINSRIESGGVLKLIFDDLKKIQEEYRSQSMMKDDRNKLSRKLDEAFNTVREKRNSGNPNNKEGNQFQGGALGRITARLKGLEDAVKKIERSIEYDQKDIDFENKRIQSSSGQLEAQIRVAKIKMIEDRIKSKKEKLDELNKIKLSLDKTTDSLKKKEEKRIKKTEEKVIRKVEEEKIKARVEEEIQAKQAENTVVEDKLIKAAEEIKESKRPRKKITTPVVEENTSTTDEQLESEEISLSVEDELEANKIADSIDELIDTALEDNNAPSDESQAPDESTGKGE